MAKHGVGPEVFPSQYLLFKNGRMKQYFERIYEPNLYSRYFSVIPTFVTSQEWREEPGNRHFVTTFAKRQLFSSPFIRALADHGRSLVLLTYTFPLHLLPWGLCAALSFCDCSLLSKMPSSVTESFHAPFPSFLIVFHSFCHFFHFVTLRSCTDLPADKTRCSCRLVTSYMWEYNENYT